MNEKRFTTVELPRPNKWGIWHDGAYLSTYQVCTLLNEYVDVKKENEQLKQQLKELKEENGSLCGSCRIMYAQIKGIRKKCDVIINLQEKGDVE